MTAEELLRAVGQVDDELIREAADKPFCLNHGKMFEEC